ncbi:MAG: hypothetical protein C5S48_00635 [Candidatus Methanogaster sp.]|nr:MAG: hypothetical protein C5S48_00635 [ANME-2 cluster archaeon]
MNNHNHTPYNNKQRSDERPFAHTLKRALLHREDESTNTAQHRSDAGVPSHNQSRIDPDRAGMRCIGVASILIAKR